MKTCSKCKKEKSVSEFNKNRLRKDGLQFYCKDCNQEAYSDWKKNNKDKARAGHRRALRSKRKWIAEFKNKPCTDCKVNYPSYVMQFDHVIGEKKFNIGDSKCNYAKQTILEEIAKCEIVCANCHAERTYQRLQECSN